MLSNVDDVVRRVGVLLDDPVNATYTRDYLIPFIDQAFDEMDVELETYGLQNIEKVVEFSPEAGASDLSSLLDDGQPLADMKVPIRVQWKLPGEPDTFFRESAFVQELGDVGPDSVGIFEWRNANGAIQITPSGQQVVLRVLYDALSTDMWDPEAKVLRGTGHILALRVAADVAGAGGDLKARQPYLAKRAYKAWAKLVGVLVMKRGRQQRGVPSIHRRGATKAMFAGGQRLLG